MSQRLNLSPRNRAETLVAMSTGVLTLDEVLALAMSPVGEYLRTLSLRDVLENLPKVNARSVVASLDAFGFTKASSALIANAIDPRRLPLLADALLVDDRSAPSPEWPFVAIEVQ